MSLTGWGRRRRELFIPSAAEFAAKSGLEELDTHKR
jgi:hypothetical protein